MEKADYMYFMICSNVVHTILFKFWDDLVLKYEFPRIERYMKMFSDFDKKFMHL